MQHPASPAVARPSCQTLGLGRVKCEACLCTQSRFIEALQSVAARCIGSSSGTCVASERAVRPLAAGALSYRAEASCSIGSAVRPLAASAPPVQLGKHAQAERGRVFSGRAFVGTEREALAVLEFAESRGDARGNTNTNAGLGPRGAVRVGAFVAHAAEQIKVRARSVLSHARPNPSVEGTCSSGLRPLPHAPHVKR